MKLKLLLFILLTSIGLSAQVSTTRINDFRLGMPKTQLEKIVGKSINLNIVNDYPSESTHVVFKGIVYEVYFSLDYDENGNKQTDYKLYSVKAKDKSLKTLSGIGVGSTLDDLIKVYKDYNFEVSDSWDDKGNRTKTLRSFSINDYDAGTYLVFTLKNNQVIEFFLSYYEGC